MSPVVAPAVPITAWEEIAIAPSEMAVQFAPSAPSARLKSSLASVAAEAPRGSANCETSRRQRITNSLRDHRIFDLEQLRRVLAILSPTMPPLILADAQAFALSLGFALMPPLRRQSAYGKPLTSVVG